MLGHTLIPFPCRDPQTLRGSHHVMYSCWHAAAVGRATTMSPSASCGRTVNALALAFLLLLNTTAAAYRYAHCGEGRIKNRQPRKLWKENHWRDGKIIGGRESSPGDWPWQVSIQLTHPYWGYMGHWCGGVLIDPVWVLTGAHCISNRLFHFPYPELWSVVIGEHNLRMRDRVKHSIRVSRIILHEFFREYHNDLALLKLAYPVITTTAVTPICLPADNATSRIDLEGVKCVATGWGQVVQGSKNSDTLQMVEIPVISNDVCRKVYMETYRIPIRKYHICAGNLIGGKGTCIGDSGGPLQCSITDGRWFLIGLTSFGSGCVKPGFPDVFTRITFYIKWILETMRQNMQPI